MTIWGWRAFRVAMLAAGFAVGVAVTNAPLGGWRWPVLAATLAVLAATFAALEGLLDRRHVPTPEEIRRDQEADIDRVLAEVAAGAPHVLVGGRLYGAESAWAAAMSIRKAWDLGGRYDGQELEEESGVWLARVELDDGTLVRAGLGQFDAWMLGQEKRWR